MVSTFPGSHVSAADQFVVHPVVTTADGFAVWDGGSIVFEYAPGLARTLTSDRWTVDGSNPFALTVAQGRLTMIAGGKVDGRDDLRLTSWTGSAWSPWTILGDGGIGIARPVPAGDDVVVLGLFVEGSTAPTRIDARLGTAAPMAGYPLSTVIDESGAWSGSELLVCGGQRSTGNASEIGTDDPGPVSDECALWRP